MGILRKLSSFWSSPVPIGCNFISSNPRPMFVEKIYTVLFFLGVKNLYSCDVFGILGPPSYFVGPCIRWIGCCLCKEPLVQFGVAALCCCEFIL